jgi:hypothetical protein
LQQRASKLKDRINPPADQSDDASEVGGGKAVKTAAKGAKAAEGSKAAAVTRGVKGAKVTKTRGKKK